jgi:hypothetical protein
MTAVADYWTAKTVGLRPYLHWADARAANRIRCFTIERVGNAAPGPRWGWRRTWIFAPSSDIEQCSLTIKAIPANVQHCASLVRAHVESKVEQGFFG